MLVLNHIHHGDCLDLMLDIPDHSIDMILADLPYATTACEWDKKIDLHCLWERYKRIIKPNGAIVLTSSDPFTPVLQMSNFKWYKYRWTWLKNFSTNFYHAKKQPLRAVEDILVFYKKQPVYNPQKTTGHVPTQPAKGISKGKLWKGTNHRSYAGGHTDRYPTNLLEIKAVNPKKRLHPSEKPVELFSYLIRTYTNPGALVLDNVAGSGTTAVAAQETGRNWLLIEKSAKWFQVASDRISQLS